MNNSLKVKIIELQEKKLVGFPVTSVFKDHNPRRIEEVKQLFMKRRNEIKNVCNENEYLCPGFSSETVFTYCFCMEVSEIEDIPEDMLGFTIPSA